MFAQLHPAVFVTAGFFLVLLAQLLHAGGLAWLLLAVLPAALLQARMVLFRVLKRLRWVFLAVLILFAWQGPGLLLLPALGRWSPTLDGALLAGEQGLRLLAMVSVISYLLARLDREAWVASLQVLLQPLSVVGVSARRFAVRLALVLSYCATGRLDWRACLHEAQAEAVENPPFVVHLRPLQMRDRLLIGVLLISLAGVIWW